MGFIGRNDELGFLESSYAQSSAQLVVLYGRRRVGKTEILSRFAQHKNPVFFAAPQAGKDEQLAAFSRQMFEAGSPASRYLRQYPDWDTALRDIANLPALENDAKRLIIIDEFPYLVRSDKSLPSLIQNLWDHVLRHANIMLILCGSSMSFVEKEILSEKSPLYGRATGILKVNPMPYWDAAQFFPNYSPADNALTFAVLGGMPHYLAQFDPDEDVATNIQQRILRRGSALYSEVEFLMHQEFREPATYNTILHAVALGATQLNDIAQRAALSAAAASTYLKNLVEVSIVEREFPVDAKPVEESKIMRGLYRISDNFFRFWYAFVAPNRSDLELGDIGGVYAYDIEPTLHDFAGMPFERICEQWLRRRNMQRQLPFHASHIGRWWDAHNEIDIVAVDKSAAHLLTCECKFRNKPMDIPMLRALQEKALRLKGQERECMLFSLGGFSPELSKLAKEDGSLQLVGIDDLYA